MLSVDSATSVQPGPFAHSPAALTKQASIIIVSYNSQPYLATCLKTVLATVGEAGEVILLDNASVDGSADFVAARFPQVKLIRSDTNLGFAAANNRAVAQAQGRYVVALNPDTLVTPGWLEALLAPFEREGQAQVGLTTPRILMLQEPHKINTCGNQMHFTGLTFCRGLNQPANSPELAVAGEVSAVSGACFALPRSLWTKLGGFDETFFLYLEDTDLSLRARLAGYTCLYVPEAVVYHDYTNRFPASKMFYLERNRWLLLLKNYQLKTLGRILPALLLTELVTWGYTFKQGWPGLKSRLQAYGWLLTHLKMILQKRRQTQQLRQVSDHELLRMMDWRLNLCQLAGPTLAQAADYTLNPLYYLVYSRNLRSRAPFPEMKEGVIN